MVTEPETDVVRVWRVSSTETRFPGLRQYAISATLVANPSRSLSLQTLSDFAASVCQRAQDLGRPIAMEHERTKYGETLRQAYFLKAETR
jgi:hypothetical protein